MSNSATVGTAVIKLSFDGKNVNAELGAISKDIDNAGKKSGRGFGTGWAVAAGSLIATGISKVAGIVSNTMGNAISRVDQLNNFPQVMTSLGYSAEEAGVSISKIGDSLDGLPTSLDAMTADVQKLAASMGNLAEGEVNATTVGLGLNNMFLAGGKGTERASAAMEQYNQMLSRGKVDMQSWNSLVDAAPGQMNQLAQSLLGVNANQTDLYAAMQAGTVTFDDLNAAIVKLDQEGGEGFDSFNKQAIAATQGISTQIENVSNTMNKIVGAALQGNTEDMGKYISQLTDRISVLVPTLIQGFTGATNALIAAAPGILQELLPAIVEGIQNILEQVSNMLPEFSNLLVESIPVIMNGLMTLLQSLIAAIPTIIPQLILAITNLITTTVTQLTRPDFLSLILQGAVTLFMSIVQSLPQILTSLLGALPTIIENVIAFLTDPANITMLLGAAVQLFLALVMAVPQILGSLLGAFGSLVGSLWNGITSMFGAFAANFGQFITGIFKGAINGMISFIENFINTPINLINGFLDIINDAFGFLGVNIGHIDNVHLPRLAQGGFVNGATTAIIGEAGAEAVLPLENNTDNWAGLLASTLVAEMEMEHMAGTGVNIEKQEFIINNQMDAEEIGRVMMQSIRRAA